MIDLASPYQKLPQRWTPDRLAARYQEAYDRGQRALETGQATRAIALVATAIPPVANLNVALHVLHVMPSSVERQPTQQLLQTGE